MLIAEDDLRPQQVRPTSGTTPKVGTMARAAGGDIDAFTSLDHRRIARGPLLRREYARIAAASLSHQMARHNRHRAKHRRDQNLPHSLDLVSMWANRRKPSKTWMSQLRYGQLASVVNRTMRAKQSRDAREPARARIHSFCRGLGPQQLRRICETSRIRRSGRNGRPQPEGTAGSSDAVVGSICEASPRKFARCSRATRASTARPPRGSARRLQDSTFAHHPTCRSSWPSAPIPGW